MKPINYGFYFKYSASNTVIPPEKFPDYRNKAWRELEPLLTSAYVPEQEEIVMLTICEIAEELYRFDGKKGIKSESVDGYTVTYADNNDVRRNIKMIAARRLGNSGLLYLGVD